MFNRRHQDDTCIALLATAAVATVSAGRASASASTFAYTISNTTAVTLGNPPFTLGFQIVTTKALKASGFGFFDSGLDGFAESHDIGLFDARGNLIESGTVAAGTGSPLDGAFRTVAFAPITLAAGAYEVGALYANGADPVLFPGQASNFVLAPGIASLRASYAFGGTLIDPTTVQGGIGYFGPNLVLSVVPEPGMFGLIAASLVALAARRRARG